MCAAHQRVFQSDSVHRKRRSTPASCLCVESGLTCRQIRHTDSLYKSVIYIYIYISKCLYIYNPTCYMNLALNYRTLLNPAEGVSNTAAGGLMVNSTSSRLLTAVIQLSVDLSSPGESWEGNAGLFFFHCWSKW